jgi:hypothetical protein
MSQHATYLRLGVTISILGLMFSSVLSAAQKSDWGAVKQLPQDQQIQIVLNDAKSYSGEFRSATDDSISVHTGTGDQTFNLPNIRRISSKGRGHHGRNALIGAAIGAGVGLGIGAAIDRCPANSIVCTGNKGKAIGTPLFALLGAAVGAVLPSGRRQTIYQSR